MAIKDRFLKHEILIDELAIQKIVRADRELAEKIATTPSAKIVEFKNGDVIIEEREESTEVYFLLDGTVNVFENGAARGSLSASEVFGETSAITYDRRTASVVASSDVVALKVDGEDFLRLSSESKKMSWNLSNEQAKRASAQAKARSDKNSAIGIFFICAKEKEHMSIVSRIRQHTELREFRVTAWFDNGVFENGKYSLESLLKEMRKNSYVVAYAPGIDKVVTPEGQERMAVRANVLFEIGLACGVVGVNNTIVLTDNANSLPSDYSGVSVTLYGQYPGRDATLDAAADILICIKKQ